MAKPPEDPGVRFLRKVAIRGPDDCWFWMGGKQINGYGTFGGAVYLGPYKHKAMMAHRFSWRYFFGEIPKGNGFHGTCVLHKCDNKACVNPNHLFLGSQKENMHDKIEKGRDHNLKKTHCKWGHPFSGYNLKIHPKRGTRMCRTCGNYKSMMAKRKGRALGKRY